jgi:hypothetical protein
MTVSTVRRLPGFRFESRAPQLTEVLPRMDVAILVGFAAAGPLDVPVALEEFAEFTAVFGGRLPLAWDAARGTQVYAYLAPAVKAFFDNGGRRCWVIRVAGESARRNFFALPGLASVAFDEQGRVQSLQPALARARAAGSWSDGWQVSATLSSQRLQAAPVFDGWPSLQLEIEAEAAALQPGDLLRLTFAEDALRAFLAVHTVEALPRVTTAARARLRVTGGPVLWCCTNLFNSPPSAVTHGRAHFFDQVGGEQALPQRQSTGRREFAPVLGGAPIDAELLAAEAEEFSVELQLPLAQAPAPGALLRLEFGAAQLLLVVRHSQAADSDESPPHELTRVQGPGLWVLPDAPTTAPTKLTAVERLTLELWTQANGAAPQRLSDLGLVAGHPRYWGALPTDEDLYQNPLSFFESQRVELAFDQQRLETWRTHDQQRFPLAGGGNAAAFTLPLAALATPEWYLPRVSASGLALERDGLARFEAALFLDRELAEAGLHDLLNQADQLRYLNPAPRGLRGLHAALGFGDAALVEEATLIAVPDALQRAWNQRIQPALPQPLPPEPEPAPAEKPLFAQCDLRPLPAPAGLQASVPTAQQTTFRLTWNAVAGASRYLLQEATRVDFSDALTLWEGSTTYLTITGRPPGDYFYRVRALDECTQSGWSQGVAVRVPEANEFQLLAETAFDPHTLLAVQRGLLRMCAARGDLLAVLALPEHFDTPAALNYQSLLSPAGAAPAFTIEYSGGVHKLRLPLDAGEARALSYAALYHPWLLTQTEAGPLAAPPEGALCGVLAARAQARGAWIAPANELLRGVVALTPPIARAQWLDWQSAQLNLVRQEARGFVVLSADTLSRDEDLRPLGVRRLLILLRRLAQRLGARYVFEPNDDSFRRLVQRGFTALLDELFARGAFAGATPATSYQVVADSALNVLQQEHGRFTIELKVAPSLPLTFLTLRVIQTSDRTRVIETGGTAF